MTSAASGQVMDHITTAGEVVEWKFTYNEGLMIGAATELYEATGMVGYLKDARRMATFCIEHETTATSHGKVLSDGPTSACGGDCHQFKGIGYRYIALVVKRGMAPKGLREILRATVDSIREEARDKDSCTFGMDWAAAPSAGSGGEGTIAQNSSTLMALVIWANLK